MERVHCPLALDREQQVDCLAYAADCLLYLGRGVEHCRELVGGQIVSNRVGHDEVAVGKSLHQRAGAEAVCAVVREVSLTNHKQARDGALQVIVHPQAAHGVVDGRIDPHRDLVRILVGDALVHLEQVVVTITDRVLAQTLDRGRKVEVHAEAGFAHAAALIANRLGIARSYVAGYQVAEARVTAFEVVIALILRDLFRGTLVALGQRHPDTAVIAQGFAHERELGLILTSHRNAGGVNLGVARVGEVCATLVSPPDRRYVRPLGVGGKVVDVAIAASPEDDCVGDVGSDGAGHQVTGDNTTSLAVDDDQVKHLGARMHGDAAVMDLPLQRLVGAQQQLLAGLAARVERTRHLGPAEGPVCERAAVLTGKGNTLGDALVDDMNAVLRQPVDVGLACAKVAALDRVIKEPVNAIAVVLVILGSVDPALRSDGVRPAR